MIGKGDIIIKDKTSISQASSYQEAGQYWDEHGLGEAWEKTEPVEFVVNIQSSTTYFPVESGLSKQLRAFAEKHGVSSETLLNMWLQERVIQEQAS